MGRLGKDFHWLCHKRCQVCFERTWKSWGLRASTGFFFLLNSLLFKIVSLALALAVTHHTCGIMVCPWSFHFWGTHRCCTCDGAARAIQEWLLTLTVRTPCNLWQDIRIYTQNNSGSELSDLVTFYNVLYGRLRFGMINRDDLCAPKFLGHLRTVTWEESWD